MKNIKLVLAYDGTSYLGWQATEMGPSVEKTLQEVLEKVLQHPIHLQAASRTDAGVHATGQVVNFLTAKEQLDLNRLQHSINALLPKDIVVISISFESPHFHPTLDCKGKIYQYQMTIGPFQLPQDRFTAWHYHYSVQLDLMKNAASLLLGEHDFSSFCNVRKNDLYEHHVRRLSRIEINEIKANQLIIEMEGNAFLFRMARNIVGTLVYVGAGKIALDSLKEILQKKDRTLAGVTAPAHGLTLVKVIYT